MIRDVAGVPPTRPATQNRPATPAAAESAPAEAAPSETAPAQGVPIPNPKVRIETSLNLVVLEFRGSDGELDRTLPTPREIDAYRMGTREPAGETKPKLDVEG